MKRDLCHDVSRRRFFGIIGTVAATSSAFAISGAYTFGSCVSQNPGCPEPPGLPCEYEWTKIPYAVGNQEQSTQKDCATNTEYTDCDHTDVIQVAVKKAWALLC